MITGLNQQRGQGKNGQNKAQFTATRKYANPFLTFPGKKEVIFLINASITHANI